MENIIFVNKDLKAISDEKKHEIGIRGRRAVELAEVGLPIAPGFIPIMSLPPMVEKPIVNVRPPKVD